MKTTSFKFRQALVASAALLGAVGLHAQTTTTTTTTPDASSTTTTQANGSTMTSTTTPTYSQTMPSQGMDSNYAHLEVDAEIAYAFRLKTAGFIGDIGANVSPMHFLGFEYSHFHPTGHTTDARAGRINSKEDINTYEFAYRFRMPLAQFAQNGMVSPVDFYAGLSGGVGTARLTTYVPQYGFSSRSEDDGILSGSGTAGLQWNVNRNWGIKAGYRYIYMHHVNLFGTRGNIDSSVVEGGLNFRW
jgi:opacity protein-like surface antigen